MLVENGRVALAAVKKNLESLGIAGAVRLIDVPWPEARRRAAAEGGPFTIVFADPPYNEAPYQEILESLSAPGLLAGNPVVVLEHESRRRGPRGGRGAQVEP